MPSLSDIIAHHAARKLAKTKAPNIHFEEGCGLISAIPDDANPLSTLSFTPAPNNSLQIHFNYKERFHPYIPEDCAYQTAPANPHESIVVLPKKSGDYPILLHYPNALEVLADPQNIPIQPVLDLATRLWGPEVSSRWAPILNTLTEALRGHRPVFFEALQIKLVAKYPDALLSRKALASLLKSPDRPTRLFAIKRIALLEPSTAAPAPHTRGNALG